MLLASIALIQELWIRGRYAEVERRVEEGIAYGRDHDLDYFFDYMLGHRNRLQALSGDWVAAEAGLQAMLAAADDDTDSGAGAARHLLPAYAQLLVRRGADDAQAVLARAVDYARRADSAYELVPALLAEIEHAWLLDKPAATPRVSLPSRQAVLGFRHDARTRWHHGTGSTPCRSLRRACERRDSSCRNGQLTVSDRATHVGWGSPCYRRAVAVRATKRNRSPR